LRGDGFDAAQEDDVAGDSDEQVDCGYAEGPGIGPGEGDDVAGDDGRGDAGELIGEVDDAADGSDAATGRDHGWDRPAYGCGGREPTDGDADPDEGAGCGVGIGRAEDAQAEGEAADEEGFADATGIVSALDHEVGKPAAREVGEAGEEPGEAGIEERVQQIDVQRAGEVAGQPREQEVEDVVVRSEADGEAEYLGLAEEVAERCRPGLGRIRLCIVSDVGSLGCGEVRIFVGIAVDAPEQDEVGEADEAGGGKAPAPADVDEDDSDEGQADSRGKLGGGVVEGGGEASFPGGEPVADGFGVCGEGGRLAYSEEEARGEETAEAGGDGGGEGGDAPDEGADASDAANAEAVQENADGKLAEGVGPVVGAGEVSEGDVGDAEGGDEGVVRDGEVDAVEVVDEDAEGEQPRDPPATFGQTEWVGGDHAPRRVYLEFCVEQFPTGA